MKPRFDALVTAAGARLPRALVVRLFRRWVGDHCVALCMHQVGEYQGPAGVAHYTYRAEQLDRLVELMLATRPLQSPPWLTVSFDDGYAAAADYVASRAARFPTVEWLFFVCPQKAERGAGFRWDLAAERREAGVPEAQVVAELRAAVDVAHENERPELQAVASRPRSGLADVARLRALGGLPGVTLGNHTNTHSKLTGLSPAQATQELQRSCADFVRLFGAQRHFAFPFGTPEVEFGAQHVELLRAQGDFLIWSTERRPYAAHERAPGAVLPRFSVDGRWSVEQVLLWIAAAAWRFARQGSRHAFPQPLSAAAGASAAAAAPTAPARAAGRA